MTQISNSKEELNNFDRSYWIAKAKVGYPYMKDKKTKNYLPKQTIFEFAPETIKNDWEIALFALTKGCEILSDISPSLTNDKQFILEVIQKNHHLVNFSSLSENLRQDKDIFLEMSLKSPHYLYRYAPMIFRQDKSLTIELANKNYYILEYLPRIFEKDIDIFKSAVVANPKAVSVLKRSMINKIISTKKDSDGIYAKDILDKDINLMRYLSKKALNDITIVGEYIKNNVRYLPLTGPKIRDNEEFMLNFAKYNISSYCSERLIDDEEFMLKLITQNTQNALSLSDRLSNDMDFSKKLVHLDAYKNLSKNMLENPHVIKELLITHPDADTIYQTPYEKRKQLMQDAVNQGKTIMEIIELECLEYSLQHNLKDNNVSMKKIKI